MKQKQKSIAAKLPKATKPEKYLNSIAEQKELLIKYCNYFGIDMNDKHFNLHYINIITKSGAIQATNEEKAELDRIYKIRTEEARKFAIRERRKDNDRLKKWRSRKIKDNNIHLNALENTFLRYNGRKKQIETTKGVEIPVKVAQRFYNWLKRTVKNGGCNGECNHEILGYSVNVVNDKFIHIGCHNVTWMEIEPIAKKLKW